MGKRLVAADWRAALWMGCIWLVALPLIYFYERHARRAYLQYREQYGSEAVNGSFLLLVPHFPWFLKLERWLAIAVAAGMVGFLLYLWMDWVNLLFAATMIVVAVIWLKRIERKKVSGDGNNL